MTPATDETSWGHIRQPDRCHDHKAIRKRGGARPNCAFPYGQQFINDMDLDDLANRISTRFSLSAWFSRRQAPVRLSGEPQGR